MKPVDIVVTWPKTRTLDSYLTELKNAARSRQLINYRVARRPSWDFGALRDRNARCYMVHDGAIRGYNYIQYVTWRGPNEVSRVANDAWAGFWPEGWYIVRSPIWCEEKEPILMKGFQGWRWYTHGVLPTS